VKSKVAQATDFVSLSDRLSSPSMTAAVTT